MLSHLDMRTILLFGTLAAVLETSILVPLWFQNRGRFAGLGFWLASFALRSVAWALVFYRDVIDPFFSIMVANALLVGAAILLYMGLMRFLGKRGTQLYNYALLAVFIAAHAYFTYVRPDLTARVVNYSVVSGMVLLEIVWLTLRLPDSETRRTARTTGIVTLSVCVVLGLRIAGSIGGPVYKDLLQSGPANSIAILAETVLWIALAFALLLMVSRRLFSALEGDIRRRILAEDSLRRSEEKFKLAFRNVPDAIVITSLADGRIIELNGGVRTLLGFSDDEALGKTTAELRIWATASDRDEFAAELTERGRVSGSQVVFRKRSGEIFPGVISSEVLEIDGERCILSLIHDNTETRRFQDEIVRFNTELEGRVQERTEELTAANEELAEANRAKSDFLTGMSHEFRTPLNSVIGFSDILLSGLAGELNPEQERQVGMVNSSGKHLLALVDDILDLSKIESGKTEAFFERVDPLALVENVVEMLGPQAADKDLDLVLVSEPELPLLDSDPRFISQILTNLLGNAIKFTASGSVRIEVASTQEAVTFTVADTGRGIAVADLPRIMERFYQARPTVEAKNAGAGLGLTISLRLAEMIGATLSASSAVGAGSTFVLRVPIGAATGIR